MNFVEMRRWLVSIVAVSGLIRPLAAATLILQPVADTTLVEIAPDNNMGATLFVNAGTSGSGGLRNRGLFKFDFGSIPANSKIKSAAVTLEVTKEPAADGQPSVFAFHRMLKAWGEGGKNSTDELSPGLGLAATANEATWNARFALTTNTWTIPGASNDFAATISSSTTVYGPADFPHFDSTAQMIADVQGWVNDPTANFGWLLKSESESTPKTARRFGSREWAGADINSPPFLEVQFVAPPALGEMRFASSRFQFSFLAEAGEAYVVQFKNALASTNLWQVLTNVSAAITSTNVLVSEAVFSSARFYRVIPQ